MQGRCHATRQCARLCGCLLLAATSPHKQGALLLFQTLSGALVVAGCALLNAFQTHCVRSLCLDIVVALFSDLFIVYLCPDVPYFQGLLLQRLALHVCLRLRPDIFILAHIRLTTLRGRMPRVTVAPSAGRACAQCFCRVFPLLQPGIPPVWARLQPTSTASVGWRNIVQVFVRHVW